jgi:hypothetical protein
VVWASVRVLAVAAVTAPLLLRMATRYEFPTVGAVEVAKVSWVAVLDAIWARATKAPAVLQVST